jgi:hypothetical protein
VRLWVVCGGRPDVTGVTEGQQTQPTASTIAETDLTSLSFALLGLAFLPWLLISRSCDQSNAWSIDQQSIDIRSDSLNRIEQPPFNPHNTAQRHQDGQQQ